MHPQVGVHMSALTWPAECGVQSGVRVVGDEVCGVQPCLRVVGDEVWRVIVRACDS